jgi:Domain of unknown function (DUF6745)
MRASLPTRYETLTPEQTAALKRYRARWTAIRRSTVPADRPAAEEGVRRAYRAAGFEPPARFVWCESPVALSKAALRPSRADGPNILPALVDRPRRRVAGLVRKRVHRRVRALVESMVIPADALVASVADAVAQAAAQSDASLLDLVLRSHPLSWSVAYRVLLDRQGFRHDAAGPHELAWLGTYEFFRNVLGLKEETEPLLGLLQAATNLGWLQPHRGTCWLAERPNLLRGDVNDRLHHASGPALGFPDGWSVWAWKGVEIPSWIIEQPDRITLSSIDDELDVQVRRCMIEIMTPQRYVAQGGAARVAEDETGILWRKTWLAYDAWAAVEVINATPEPDGTHRHFFLQVPANLETAREAVAWTYGMSAEAYAKLIVRT